MEYTKFLNFEIGNQCNLTEAHSKLCPIALPDRYGRSDASRPLTDDVIIECAKIAYLELRFRGLISWHYYNEPMLDWERIKPLMMKIKKEIPAAGFVLWTNGTIMPKDISELRIFSNIYLTNYEGRDWEFLRLKLPNVNVTISDPCLDGRAACRKVSGNGRCPRPFDEMIIDYYGNGHLCCLDFRGECKLGNVWTDGFRTIAKNFFNAQKLICEQPMPKAAPRVCRYCAVRPVGQVTGAPFVKRIIKKCLKILSYH